MNIFNKVTIQSMKKNRTRTIVTIIGVILSTAMITAIATFAVSLQNYMVNGAIVKYGNWHVEFPDANYTFTNEIKNNDMVLNSASFENIGYASWNGIKSENKPYLFVAGFNDKAFETLPLTLVAGKMPEHSNEILIPTHVATKGGVKFSIGDTITLSVGNRVKGDKNLNQNDPYTSKDDAVKEVLVPKYEKTYTVVGICERPGFEDSSSAGYTLITKCEIQDKNNSASTFVTLKNPRKIHDFVNNSAKTNSYVLNDNVLRFMGLSDNNLFNALLYSVGGVLVVLIMIGSVFLIYNSFNISLNERTKQFGILSSIGATSKQIRNSVLFEGICIGAVGIPIGIIVGISSISVVITIVARNLRNIFYNTVPLTLKSSIPTIIIAIAVSMITILISAYIPARKAANTSVLESIRQTSEIKIDSKSIKTSKFSQRIYGLEGILALKNFKRNKKRYFSIILSLTFSVVLFVSARAFGTYLEKATSQAVVDNDYDICFSTKDISENELFNLYNKLKDIDGIYESSYQALMKYSCKADTANFSEAFKKESGYDDDNQTVNIPIEIQFIEDSQFLKFIESINLPINEYTGKNPKMIAVAKIINSKNNELPNIFTKDSMNLSIAPEINGNPNMNDSKNVNIKFIDTVPLDTLPQNHSDVKSYMFLIVAPYTLKDNFEATDLHTNVGFTFRSKNPTQSVSEMESIIQSVGLTSDYNIYNVYEVVEQNRNIMFVVNIFTYVFVIMISLIAIANVFNTISTNIKLRRRELAMLLSIGMSDHDFKKMMNFECVFYGIRTLIFGIPISALFSWLIYKGLVAGGADLTFIFPWSSMIISIISVFCIVFITMLYSIGKIKKENIIDSLRDDMA